MASHIVTIPRVYLWTLHVPTYMCCHYIHLQHCTHILSTLKIIYIYFIIVLNIRKSEILGSREINNL